MATNTKTTATPKRRQASSKNADRPVKPEFQLIGDNLHYSPDGERDIVVSVDPIWRDVEPIVGADLDQGDAFKAILIVLYGDDGADEKIRDLKTSQFFKLAYRWMDEFSKKMGIDAGE